MDKPFERDDLKLVTEHARVRDAHWNPAKDGDSLIWHYTKLDVLHNMIQYEDRGERYIRAHPVEKMNDHREGRWLASVLHKRHLDARWLLQPRLEGPSRRLYAACFSGDGDLLSQWRAYADGSRGVAIGFKQSKLAEAIKWRPYMPDAQAPLFIEVDYTNRDIDKDDFINILTDVVQNTSNHAMRLEHPGDRGSFMRNVPYYVALMFNTVEPLFKNGHFSEEKEWRLVFPDSTETTHYQFLQDDIVPFIRIPVGGIIDSVRLGPLSRVAPDILCRYLKLRLGYDVAVSQSKSTLQ